MKKKLIWYLPCWILSSCRSSQIISWWFCIIMGFCCTLSHSSLNPGNWIIIPNQGLHPNTSYKNTSGRLAVFVGAPKQESPEKKPVKIMAPLEGNWLDLGGGGCTWFLRHSPIFLPVFRPSPRMQLWNGEDFWMTLTKNWRMIIWHGIKLI